MTIPELQICRGLGYKFSGLTQLFKVQIQGVSRRNFHKFQGDFRLTRSQLKHLKMYNPIFHIQKSKYNTWKIMETEEYK